MMDHRHSARMPVRLTVDIFTQDRFIGRFKTRNLDVDGVFVEMSTIGLRLNEILKLILFVPNSDRGSYTVDASVARVDTHGTGMILLGNEDTILEVLKSAENVDSIAPGGVTKDRMQDGNTASMFRS
jgi:hypothetical protein